MPIADEFKTAQISNYQNNNDTNKEKYTYIAIELITRYLQRKYTEELDFIVSIGGFDTIKMILNTDSVTGILLAINNATITQEVEHRKKIYGINAIRKPYETPFYVFVWEAGKDPMLQILAITSIISIFITIVSNRTKISEWIESIAIFVTIFIVIFITAINDYRSEKNFIALYETNENFCSVIRNRNKVIIKVNDLVVGDLIYLECGDLIPADCFVTQSIDFLTDESNITGESKNANKNSLEACIKAKLEYHETNLNKDTAYQLIPSPILLSESIVTAGFAYAIVLAVGSNSQTGRLYTKITIENKFTPLQHKLNSVTATIGYYGIICAIIVFLILLSHYIISSLITNNEFGITDVLSSVVEYIIIAITIIVLAVPEGLPLAVTISLAYSVRKMLKDNNYVRKLIACETMGSATVICTDKTGTLTKNEMSVTLYWNGSLLYTDLDQDSYNVSKLIFDTELALPNQGRLIEKQQKQPSKELFTSLYSDILAHNIAVNSTASITIETVKFANQEASKYKFIGNPTECALFLFINKFGYDTDLIKKMYQNLIQQDAKILWLNGHLQYSNLKIIHQIPFNSIKKAMSVFVKIDPETNILRLYIKGAFEAIVNRSKYYIDNKNKVSIFSNQHKKQITEYLLNNLKHTTVRYICLAYRDFDESQFPDYQINKDYLDDSYLQIENNLTCLGIAGIKDPLRPEVNECIQNCHRASVKVKICTGDNIETAKQIGLASGIYNPLKGGIAITGEEFMKFVGGIVCSNCMKKDCICDSENVSHAAKNTFKTCVCTCRSIKDNSVYKKQTTSSDVLLYQEKFAQIADKIEILARSQPIDKYALIVGLQNMNEVVAVTGDGTNDAPALRKADVGFSMGITGKEAAKQASDIVLLDDNFKSIINAIKWGRNIYDNIQKFLQFQITVNICAVITSFVSSLFYHTPALNAIQVLWINLIMDTFAALALATEKPEDEQLDTKPRKNNEYIITKFMWSNIFCQLCYQLIVIFILMFTADCWVPEKTFSYNSEKYTDYSPFASRCGNGKTIRQGLQYNLFSITNNYKKEWYYEITPSRHLTLIFNTFVFLQLFNMICTRRNRTEQSKNIFRGLFNNYYWIVIISLSITFQVIIIQFSNYIFGVHKNGLTITQWFISVLLGAGSLLAYYLNTFLAKYCISYFPEIGNKELIIDEDHIPMALISRGLYSSTKLQSRTEIKPNNH